MKILLFQENKRKSPSTRKLSAALTASYEITCDICVNSIHKYIYIYIFRSGKCQYSVCNVLCKCIVLSVKMENYDKNFN